MKRTIPLITLIFLTACTTAETPSSLNLPLLERLRNPLVAERYWSGMAEHMADFVRTKDPILKDVVKAGIIDAERLRALERVNQARTLIKQGVSGPFKTVSLQEDAFGQALLKDSTLFFDTTFEIKPNPSVHVFLTTAVDPRNVAFPDKGSADLGPLQTAFGAQQYEIPQKKMNPAFRTAVLYDTQLDRVIGFAQLNK